MLILIRNILHVPSNPETERRADNDASLHDQVLWALQQSGILDLVLYIVGSEFETQYHLHAIEIICLMYREQVSSSHLQKNHRVLCITSEYHLYSDKEENPKKLL